MADDGNSLPDPLGLRRWRSAGQDDGYCIGNGRMYMVAALGDDLQVTRFA